MISQHKLIYAVEEAVELSNRFPDLPEYEVIEHVNDVCNMRISAWLETLSHRVVMAAYYGHNVQDGKDLYKAFTGEVL